MTIFTKKIQLRWSDLDPNFHLRHSVFYDLGSQHRIEILESLGLTTRVMQQEGFGPVLFREECIFKKEILLGDEIAINTSVAKMRTDGARWTIQHEFIKDEEKLCAVLTVDGAWMDVRLRKLADPTPEIAFKIMDSLPKTESFISF